MTALIGLVLCALEQQCIAGWGNLCWTVNNGWCPSIHKLRHQRISSENWCKISDIVRFKFTSDMSAYRWFLNWLSGNVLCASCTVFPSRTCLQHNKHLWMFSLHERVIHFRRGSAQTLFALCTKELCDTWWDMMRHDDHCHHDHHRAWYSMIHRCHCYIVIHDDTSWCSVVHVTS